MESSCLSLKQQIFTRQSLSEAVRFSDRVFWGKFSLAENLASIF